MKLPIILTLLFFLKASAQVPELSVTLDGDDIVLGWQSTSLSNGATSLNYNFQIQGSDDLQTWSDMGAEISGGIGGSDTAHTDSFPVTSSPAYFRLHYKIDLSGESLTGVDLSDIDLTGADLSNADLTGADLSGSDLQETNLNGAIFNLARLENATFSPHTPESYVLEELYASPGGSPISAIPDLPFYASQDDFTSGISGFEDISTSAKTIILTLGTGATIADLNNLLDMHGGTLAGSIGQSIGMTTPLVAVRFADADVTSIKSIRAALVSSPHIDAAVLDMEHQNRVISGYPRVETLGDWQWDSPTVPDGNWGLEWARIPQMWNFNDAIQRLIKERRGGSGPATSPKIAVIDGGFDPRNRELRIASLIGLNEPDSVYQRHGTHVAGIVAAEVSGWPTNAGHGGVDGVDPFCLLVMMNYARPFTFYSQLKDISWMAKEHQPRVINCSYGQVWGKIENDVYIRIDPDSRPETQAEIDQWSKMARANFLALRLIGRAPLMVLASGNDNVDSEWAGAMERFARVVGSDDILVVGAQAQNSANFASFSNSNVDILAPGQEILSTVPGGGYERISGTSMATPFVTGVASYLIHINPALTNAELKFLLTKGNVVPPGVEVPNPPVLDGFGSAFLIDTLGWPPERSVKEMLLDCDDGTPDGNLRQRYRPPATFDSGSTPQMEIYEKPWTTQLSDPGGTAHPDETILTRPGDGRIDMSDFRVFRDHLLYYEEAQLAVPAELDGGSGNKKLDANHDGIVGTGVEEDFYPRTDFNGDGGVSRFELNSVITDFGVFEFSGLWSDPYVPVTDLSELLDSGEIRIVLTDVYIELALNFNNFYIEISDGPGGPPTVREVDANLPGGNTLDPRFLWNYHIRELLLTVPKGTKNVKVQLRRGRNNIVLATFEETLEVGGGEDAFFHLGFGNWDGN